MANKNRRAAVDLMRRIGDPMTELGVALGVLNEENDEKLKAGLSGEDYDALRQARTAMIRAFLAIAKIDAKLQAAG